MFGKRWNLYIFQIFHSTAQGFCNASVISAVSPEDTVPAAVPIQLCPSRCAHPAVPISHTHWHPDLTCELLWLRHQHLHKNQARVDTHVGVIWRGWGLVFWHRQTCLCTLQSFTVSLMPLSLCWGVHASRLPATNVERVWGSDSEFDVAARHAAATAGSPCNLNSWFAAGGSLLCIKWWLHKVGPDFNQLTGVDGLV